MKFVVEFFANVSEDVNVEAPDVEAALKKATKKARKTVVTMTAHGVSLLDEKGKEVQSWERMGECESCGRALLRDVTTDEANVKYGRDEDGVALCEGCYPEDTEAP